MPNLTRDHLGLQAKAVWHPPPPTGATGRERPPWGAFLKPPPMGVVDYCPVLVGADRPLR
jgi:hypothetical protein